MLRSNKGSRRTTLTRNAIWFLASLLLSSFVWIIAITEDAQERRFAAIPVQFEFDEGLIITDQPTRNVRVNVRAPQDVLGLLTNEDIVVQANLNSLGPGTHTIELEPIISRRLALADTQPRQVTVTLEELLSQQVNVSYEITDPPPLDFDNSDPIFSESQVMITGPRSAVQEVVAAVAEFDLSDQQETLEQVVRLSPIDVDGNVIDDVTLNPQNVTATIEMRRRDNVTRIAVSPDIDFSTLEEGYVISGPILYDPPSVFVYGTPEDLENLPSTLDTDLIDLTGRTNDFEIKVPVLLPDALTSLRVDGDQIVNVSLVIDAQTTNRQLDDVLVIANGLGAGLDIQISPEEASVVITGAVPILDDLSTDDISITIDVSNLDPGVYDLDAIAIVSADVQSADVLPPTIQVTITEPEVGAEAIETAMP